MNVFGEVLAEHMEARGMDFGELAERMSACWPIGFSEDQVRTAAESIDPSRKERSSRKFVIESNNQATAKLDHVADALVFALGHDSPSTDKPGY